MLVHQACGAVHVQRLLGRLGQRVEGRRQHLEELALGRRQGRIVQAGVEHAGAQAHADQPLVQVGRGPLGQAGVDRPLEGEDALGDAAGRGDDDHHEDLRLQDQHLDVPDRRRVHGRGGHDGHEVGDLRERLRGRAHGRVDLAAHELRATAGARRRAPRAGAGRRSSGSRRRWAPGRPRCAGARAGPAPRAARARCGSCSARPRARPRWPAPWSPPGHRWPCSPPRPCGGAAADGSMARVSMRPARF